MGYKIAMLIVIARINLFCKVCNVNILRYKQKLVEYDADLIRFPLREELHPKTSKRREQ